MSGRVHLDFVDHLVDVPPRVKRNLELMRELDYKAQDQYKAARRQLKQYMKLFERKKDPAAKARAQAMLPTLLPSFDEPIITADEKVVLANETYDLIDEQIRRLDATLAEFQAELGINEQILPTPSNKKQRRRVNAPSARSSLLQTATSAGAVGGSAAGISASSATASAGSALVPGRAAQGSSAGNGSLGIGARSGSSSSLAAAGQAVDPAGHVGYDGAAVVAQDTERYCHCGRGSIGLMVMCDNPQCKHVWFHFECVGLTEEPIGGWMCGPCKSKKQRRS